MDSIDLLEKRIATLELQVLPKAKDSLGSSQVVTDLLLQTQTMVSSALSLREAITTILQRMTTINEYLDPSYGDNETQVEAKRCCLLELYPELKDTIQLIGTFEELVPCADSKNFLKIMELLQKLEQFTISNLQAYDECGKVTQNVLEYLQKYNDITMSIKVLFAQLDKAVTDLEVALKTPVREE